jgi:hypothetical protein
MAELRAALVAPALVSVYFRQLGYNPNDFAVPLLSLRRHSAYPACPERSRRERSRRERSRRGRVREEESRSWPSSVYGRLPCPFPVIRLSSHGHPAIEYMCPYTYNKFRDWPDSTMALRLRNRRLYPLFFLILCAAAITAWLIFPTIRQPGFLVSAIGSIAGLTYFLYRQHLDETKLFKELFTEFNRRYDDLNDGLNAIRFAPPGNSLSAQEKECLFSYFSLCAEEYLFYKAGYIDRDAWKSWCRGMKVFFGHPAIREVWKQDSESDSYYGFQPPQ